MSIAMKPFKRWSELESSAPIDREIGALFGAITPPSALSPAALVAVRERLNTRHSNAPLSLLRYVALLATGMLAGTGFALASYGVHRLVSVEPSSAPAAAPPEHAPVAVERRSPAVAPELAVPGPSSEPELTLSTPPAPSSGALARESELLGRALLKLRKQRDAAGALVLLDEHQRTFPGGVLGLEANLARLDALLALGRHADALALLDRLPLERSGRGAELRIVRAELRATSEPARALADFDLALSGTLTPALEERALFGRAGVRLRFGDRAGARHDLTRYLERYPAGRFAERARDALAAP